MRNTTTLAAVLGCAVFAIVGCSNQIPEPEEGTQDNTATVQAEHRRRPRNEAPKRVVIVLFDQMIPAYADDFDMPNYRRIRDAGTNFKEAHLGYMASETVIAHNVLVSGREPRHMGWVDEAFRDKYNLLGKGAGEMHITGDLSIDDFGTLVNNQSYPKLADYLHDQYPGSKFISVGQKAYAVESIAAATGDIAVRLSGRSSSSLFDECRTTLGGRYRFAAGKNVPAYLTQYCGRYYINSDGGNSYGTTASFPAWLYPEDGDRLFPGTNAAHLGGDTWVADAAVAMMQNEDWSGMFVTLGGIDKAGHMFGAQADTGVYDCSTGAGQVHVRCAAQIADQAFGKILAQIAATDAAKGGETLVVMTADHGATYAENFYGKTNAGASDSNWYHAPVGVWDVGAFVPPTNPLYNTPSPSLAPLIATNNMKFTYQSTAIEAWLIDNSKPKMIEAAAAALGMPGVIATYYRSANGKKFKLYDTNSMTPSEKRWWKDEAEDIVNTMASDEGPDVVARLHDKVSYGVHGDHGGAQESVQRVPMVFWSPSLAPRDRSRERFLTPDVMPTILKAMDIDLEQRVDGKAHKLDSTHR